MNKKSFVSSGHLPTLISAFLYFDVSFMVWVIFGPMTPFIADQMHLTATQKGLLTAIPLLGGSFFRPLLGLLADRIGGRRAGLAGLTLTLVPLILGWHYASALWQFYLIGFMLGIAGASFAVALPLAGRWYPAEHQGLAMGIAGAGNSGMPRSSAGTPSLDWLCCPSLWSLWLSFFWQRTAHRCPRPNHGASMRNSSSKQILGSFAFSTASPLAGLWAWQVSSPCSFTINIT